MAITQTANGVVNGAHADVAPAPAQPAELDVRLQIRLTKVIVMNNLHRTLLRHQKSPLRWRAS